MLSDANQFRLHLRSILALTGVLVIGVVTLATGCRGGARPFSRFVKVTEQPDSEIPNIDAPNQRLVTGNPKLDGAIANSNLAEKKSASNDTGDRVELAASDEDRYGKLTRREQVAKNRRVADIQTRESDQDASKIASSKTNPATRRELPPVHSMSREELSAKAVSSREQDTVVAAKEVAAPTKPAQPAKRRLTQKQYDRIMAAFKDQPEAVRREAMRRLASVMAVDAPVTQQPKSLNQSLADQVADLPELPPSGTRTANRPLRRPGDLVAGDTNAATTPASKATVATAKDGSVREVATTSIGEKPGVDSATPKQSQDSEKSIAESPSQRRTTVATAAQIEKALDYAKNAIDRPSSPTTASLSDLMGGELSPSPTDVISAALGSKSMPSTMHAAGAVNAVGTKQDDLLSRDPAVLAASAMMRVPGVVAPAIDTHEFVDNPPTSVLEFDSEPTPSADAAEPALVEAVDDATQMTSAQPVVPSLPAVAGATSPELDPATLDEKVLYQTLVKRLSAAPAGETEADRAARLIKLRHLMVLSGDPDAAVEKIDGMSETEQEYLRHQLLGLWTMVDPNGHPVHQRRLSNAIGDFRQATQLAAAATDALEVRSLAFCTEIESYGQIKTFEGNRFDAGQAVILYCEIDNFTAKETGEGFLTKLQGSYDIYDSNNKKVISQLLPADEQTSSNYLRDYFIAYQMHLPASLEPGTYRLQLTMEDLNAKKYGQSSIPLEISK